jgi:hypothetical protein
MATLPASMDDLGAYTRRAWIVLLLYALERNTLTPTRKFELHDIAYYANSMAPVFGLEPNDGKILKARRGPLYTDLQWEVDRLVFMGLVEISEITFGPEKGQFSASYGLSDSGLRIAKEIAAVKGQPALLADFLMELISAFGRAGTSDFPKTFDRDANYSNRSTSEGEVIDFAEWSETNYTFDATKFISEGFSDFIGIQPAEELDLYIRYLTQVSTRGDRS